MEAKWPRAMRKEEFFFVEKLVYKRCRSFQWLFTDTVWSELPLGHSLFSTRWKSIMMRIFLLCPDEQRIVTQKNDANIKKYNFFYSLSNLVNNNIYWHFNGSVMGRQNNVEIVVVRKLSSYNCFLVYLIILNNPQKSSIVHSNLSSLRSKQGFFR